MSDNNAPAFEDTVPVDDSEAAPAQQEPQGPAFEDTVPVDGSADTSQQPNGAPYNPLDIKNVARQQFANAMTFGGSDYALSHLKSMVSSDPTDTPEKEQAKLNALSQQHPIAATIGNVLGSTALIGSGEGALGISEAIAKLPTGAKIVAHILNGMVTGGILQGGDEISKSILTPDGDPTDSLGSALTNIGTAALIGGTASGGMALAGMAGNSALKAISNTKIGNKTSQWLADFAKQYHLESLLNDDVPGQMTDELRNYHTSTNQAMEEIHGTSGIKSQAIDNLAKDITPEQVSSHIDKVNDIIDNAPELLKESPDFKYAVSKWRATATPPFTRDPFSPASQAPPPPKANDAFKATDAFKRDIQQMAKFDTAKGSGVIATANRNAAGSLSHNLRMTLEDPKDFGDLGLMQKNLNEATSAFIGKDSPSAEFNSQFGSKIAGDPSVDADKIKNHINQLSRGKGDKKQEILKRYIDSAEKYRQQVDDLHAQAGLPSPFQEAPLTATKTMMDKLPSGAGAARTFYRDFLPKVGSMTTGAVAGYGIGKLTGQDSNNGLIGGALGGLAGGALASKLIPAYEATIGRGIKKYAIPAALRVMQAGEPEAMGPALDYADKVNKGQYTIKTSLDNLFRSSAQKVYNGTLSPVDEEKIKDFVKKGGTASQVQNEANQPPAPPPQPQKFAEGGEVKQQMIDNSFISNNDRKNNLESVMPKHAAGLSNAKSRIYTYLNGIRPIEKTNLPFDETPNNKLDDIKYKEAIHTAAHPLRVLNKIKDGSLGTNDMNNLIGMHPEVHQVVSKEMTKRLLQMKMDGDKPPYKMRQALSLFTGSPLDTTFTPSSIQAIQSTFAPKQPQGPQQAQGKTKKGTSTLGKSNKSYMTAEQSAENDRTERD
jgi:hypothetical protein